MGRKKKTMVGVVDEEVLAYTAGDDVELDTVLIEADCLATAAHVVMLSRLPIDPPLFTRAQCRRVLVELRDIIRKAARGEFAIHMEDQDVHLAIERALTERLGDVAKNVHCGRSRNDLVATDLRLYAKDQLLDIITETAALAGTFTLLAEQNVAVPMVGRTHLQPAMPSSVGLWASAYAEALLDDLGVIRSVYELNDRCPLGAAAGYGVPLPLDRKLVARLLGFREPVHNVLYAVSARGKLESMILTALAQVMLTLSRFAEDVVLFCMPEFGYFTLPAEFFTGSSIMPQKRNPDLFELTRSRAAIICGLAHTAQEVVRAAPAGYQRDVQDIKALLLQGFHIIRSTLRVMLKIVPAIKINEKALSRGFRPDVFAADRALELVAAGVPFREAYQRIKETLSELQNRDPVEALRGKNQWGGPAGLDFSYYRKRIADFVGFAERERSAFRKSKAALLQSL